MATAATKLLNWVRWDGSEIEPFGLAQSATDATVTRSDRGNPNAKSPTLPRHWSNLVQRRSWCESRDPCSPASMRRESHFGVLQVPSTIAFLRHSQVQARPSGEV